MFELMEHTADIGFRARGATLEQLFASAALALQSIAVEMDAVEERAAYPIAADGDDQETLLVSWLNEVLYYLDGRQVLLARFEFEELSPNRVRARAWGEPRDAGRHPPKLVVKGVTYHLLEVRREQEGWFAQVVLDI